MASDMVIWAETFMYKKHSTINRACIKAAVGPQWLTIPVQADEHPCPQIRDVKIDQAHFKARAHVKSLQVSYQNSPYYFFMADEVNSLLEQTYSRLNQVCFESLHFLCRKLRIKTTIHSSADLPPVQDRSERVVRWLAETGCSEYLIEAQEAGFIHSGEIQSRGYSVITGDFSAPHYHQLFSDFLPNLSGLDLLFNEGEKSRSILANSFVDKQG
jgi:hypothetical protein